MGRFWGHLFRRRQPNRGVRRSVPQGLEQERPQPTKGGYKSCLGRAGRRGKENAAYSGMIWGTGAPERIRTSDLCLRRAALYPAELRARGPRSVLAPCKRVYGLQGVAPSLYSFRFLPKQPRSSHGDRRRQGPPAFTLKDQNGEKVALKDLKGQNVVIYFYPKDDTPGCTKEACGFRDLGAKFW